MQRIIVQNANEKAAHCIPQCLHSKFRYAPTCKAHSFLLSLHHSGSLTSVICWAWGVSKETSATAPIGLKTISAETFCSFWGLGVRTSPRLRHQSSVTCNIGTYWKHARRVSNTCQIDISPVQMNNLDDSVRRLKTIKLFQLALPSTCQIECYSIPCRKEVACQLQLSLAIESKISWAESRRLARIFTCCSLRQSS